MIPILVNKDVFEPSYNDLKLQLHWHQPNIYFKNERKLRDAEMIVAFPGGTIGKEPSCQCRRHKRCGFEPGVRKTPWKRAQQPTPVENPMEEEPGTEASVHRVTKRQT